EVFHRYTIYRPEMLARWTSGASDAPTGGRPPVAKADDEWASWQRELWRRLVSRTAPALPSRGARHLGERLTDLIADLRTKSSAAAPLIAEPRLILFGHHTLPPLFIDALVALSEHVDVHLFRLTVGLGNLDHSAVRPHPLRASLGRLADDLTRLLDDKARGATVHDLYVSPAPTTLLGRLKLAVLKGIANEHLGTFDPSDDSLQFHACSSELRQVEVLRDELLALFSKDPGIEPRDVIVMTPDIETYAPLVDAVFRDGDPNLRDEDPRSAGFPPIHRLHDRSLRRTNPVAESFLAVLDLVFGRHTLPQILDLVTLAPVLAKAGLEEEDLAQIQRLAAAAGIRWGDDEEHRARHGQPRLRSNTWREGFDRLLCGHAMASDGLTTWQGMVPVDEVEGKEVEQLGLFIDYVERLFAELEGLEAPRTIPEWRAALMGMTERLLVSDDESAGLAQPIYDELAALDERARAGGFSGLIDFDAMKALIVPPFEARRPSISFLSGGLTFCTLLPMRTIPFKVVALLGMDSGTFPRAGEVLGFDLMEHDVQRGDRAPRDDDRMTFLETLAAAERHLIVTWTGI
ncbi:MAG TPA: exodeoxyribonuclease V subunit gamma, partial [Myxococcota bacterium]|nr:exodeoxyribonuclease V subunit gamma [Myxococcota bacterium]